MGRKTDAAASEGHPAPPLRELAKGSIASGLIAAMFLLAAAPAALAAPANDRVEDAQVVGPALPVLVSGSNEEATAEGSEDPDDPFAAGHSVWYRWIAPGDEKATIDTCNSEFATRLTVFTGSTLGSLVEVARDTNVDGRYCPDGAGATVQTTAGTTYTIMIDGYAFSFPGSPAPVTEGSFELKLDHYRPPESDISTPPAELAPEESSQPPADTTPPRTAVRKHFLKRKRIWLFRLTANELGSTFRCKLDKRRYRRCKPPLRLRHLKPGRHVLRVFAVDTAGNRDRSPAVAHFRVRHLRHGYGKRNHGSNRASGRP